MSALKIEQLSNSSSPKNGTGGQSVPEPDIRRGFKRGLENLMNAYRFIVDDWQVYDNQTDKPRMVAFGRPEGVAFKDQEFYNSVKHCVEKI